MPKNQVFPIKFVAPLYTGATFNPINSSLIATALVAIATHMKVPASEATILITVFALASAVAYPAAGRLAEVFGPRRLFIAGTLLVLLGGLVGGFGMNLAMLIVSRVLMGFGTSASYPAAMLMIRRRATAAGLSEPPSNVLGMLQISASVTGVVGLPLGGILVGLLGWRVAFWINAPFTIVAFVMAWLWLPKDAPSGAKSLKAMYADLDGTGICAFAAMMTALLAFLFTLSWVLLALGAVFGAFLVWWELRIKLPFIDVRLLVRNMALSRVYLRYAGFMLCCYIIIYGLTQWLEATRGLDSFVTGLLIMPMSLVSTIVAWFVSRSNMIRGTLIIAVTFCVVASASMFFLSKSAPIVFVVVITVLFGVMMGTMTIGNQAALYALAPATEMGTASGLFRTFGYIGTIASSAIINLAFQKGVSDAGLHKIAITMIAVSAAILLLTVTDHWVMNWQQPRSQA